MSNPKTNSALRVWIEQQITKNSEWPIEAESWTVEKFSRWMDSEINARMQAIMDDTDNLVPLKAFKTLGLDEMVRRLEAFGLPHLRHPQMGHCILLLHAPRVRRLEQRGQHIGEMPPETYQVSGVRIRTV